MPKHFRCLGKGWVMKYDINNINSEWSNLFKGYYYERYVQEVLTHNNIGFVGNPEDYDLWKQYTTPDYDIYVNGKKIECKLTLTEIYYSWFERDWLSRDCDIIVTNDKFNIPYEGREELRRRRIRLFDVFELLEFLLDGNKLNNNKYNITSKCYNGKLGSKPILTREDRIKVAFTQKNKRNNQAVVLSSLKKQQHKDRKKASYYSPKSSPSRINSPSSPDTMTYSRPHTSQETISYSSIPSTFISLSHSQKSLWVFSKRTPRLDLH